MTLSEFKETNSHNIINFIGCNDTSKARKRKLKRLKRATDQLKLSLENIL